MDVERTGEGRPGVSDVALAGERLITHKLGSRLALFSQFASKSRLEKSKVYQSLRPEIERLTNGLEFGCYADTAKTASRPFYRIVSWDLHHGLGFEGIVDVLRTHPILSKADIFFFPSVDVGMARTDNRNVARSLALELELNYVYAPSYLHIPPAQSDGKNDKTGLDGNAILSRYPLHNPRIVSLENCKDPMKGPDKALGHQKALMADVAFGDKRLTAICTHMDVLSSPRQRAAQMRHIMHHIDVEKNLLPILIGGVFNTSTYDAHSSTGLIAGLVNKLVRGVDYILEEHHTFPERHFDAALFEVLKRNQFSYEPFNEMGKGTFHYTMEDLKNNVLMGEVIPEWLMRVLGKIMRRHGDKVSLKLDWFAGNGKVAPSSHPHAEKPKVVSHLFGDTGRVSIHDAVVLDFEIP